MKKNVLLIGGGGFIGSNIARFLILNRDYNVDIIDNFSRGDNVKSQLSDSLLKSEKLNIFSGDLTDIQNFKDLRDDYDFVFMLAAVVGVDKVNSVPDEVIKINTLLTINVLEWLKKSQCKKVVFSSTSETYAGTIEAFNYDVPTKEDVPLTIENVEHPRFTYAITKMLGESGFINYARKNYFEAVIVRYHNVYGPMMGFRHVLPHLVERFRKNESPFKIYGHDQTRSFNFIDDAVRGTVLAIENGKNMNIYHIGDSQEITIETLTKYVGDLLNYSGEYEYAPTFPGSVSRRCPDISKAEKHLNYVPETSWKEGVKKTVEWYSNYLDNENNQVESFYDQYGISK